MLQFLKIVEFVLVIATHCGYSQAYFHFTICLKSFEQVKYWANKSIFISSSRLNSFILSSQNILLFCKIKNIGCSFRY